MSPRTVLGNFGDDENRQEQVEHDRVGCQSLGVLLPQRRAGMRQTAELPCRGERKSRGSPGRMSVVGLEPHQAWFCFIPSDPAVLQPGGREERGGCSELSVGALHFCPISPSPTM